MSNQQPVPEANYCIRCGSGLATRREGEQERRFCPVCGWVYYPKSNQASAVAILENGRVLMVRRKHEPFQGQWTMPSGFLEYGESAEEGALREMREEIGVEVELTDLVDVLMERGDPRGPCLLVVYTGRITGGQLRAGDDAAEFRWFPLEQLPDRIAFNAHRQALQKIAAQVRR